MGCLTVTVSPALPTVVARAVVLGGAQVSASEDSSHPDVSARVLNRIEATASDMHSDVKISAWIVCRAGNREAYLAVQEGWLMTIDDGYLTVRRM